MKYPREKIEAAYKKLSDIDRELFMAPETADTIWDTAGKYNLTGNKETTLTDLTVFVVLKLDPIENLTENISKDLQVEMGVANAIKDDLINRVISRFENYNSTTQQSTPTSTVPTVSVGNDWQIKVGIAAQKQSLTEKQKEKIKSEVQKIINGQNKASDFRANLVREAGITYDQALKISTEVIPQILSSVQTNKETPNEQAKNLLPDHEQITKTDGPHMHSQNVMPAKPAAVSTSTPAPVPKPLSQPVRPTVTAAPTTPAFKSIVDQKLSGMVRSSNAPANLPTSEKDLQEMMKKAEGVTMGGYKGVDPYREPIE